MKTFHVLSFTGMKLDHPEEANPLNIKAMPLLCSLDLPAKAHFMDMTYYSGASACKDCLIQGQRIPSGKGTATYYSYQEAINALKHTDDSYLDDALEANETGERVIIDHIFIFHNIVFLDFYIEISQKITVSVDR